MTLGLSAIQIEAFLKLIIIQPCINEIFSVDQLFCPYPSHYIIKAIIISFSWTFMILSFDCTSHNLIAQLYKPSSYLSVVAYNPHSYHWTVILSFSYTTRNYITSIKLLRTEKNLIDLILSCVTYIFYILLTIGFSCGALMSYVISCFSRYNYNHSMLAFISG